ncbi:methyltransferase domain-containing protein [Stenotrophomonas rhizophila]|uniref:class I SAM-dependent methyltransferase n=1 Tax=Stenotrophomonas rhizophila TaxID=216778 RepID=UPI00224A6875|nr:methyltransferase domain-containing protein [Stenotrophomonas rhizophila]MCX2919723.1 methyltransferase domain-containing protein [Stenotrophomonas rhizophila]
MRVLSPDDLAIQLRHPHGIHALAVAQSMNRSNGDLNRAALALLSVTAGEQVLEIGPGNAAFAPALLRAPHSRYLGVDVSATMVAAGNALLAGHGLQDRAELHLGDAHALPLDEACIDAALAVNTLYFWEELKLPFAELARVLRPGGRLCLAFGDAAFMRTLPFAAHGFHLHELAEVEQALRSAGLTVQAWRAHHETGRSNDGREVNKHFHLLLVRRL